MAKAKRFVNPLPTAEEDIHETKPKQKRKSESPPKEEPQPKVKALSEAASSKSDDNKPPSAKGKSKVTKQSAASSSSNKKIIIKSTPISAQKEKPVDESHLKKTKSYWRGLDLTELIKELETRGQAIEPPVSEAKTVKGTEVRETSEQ